MKTIKLGDLFLGMNDGKKEALYRDDFDRFFYDHKNLVDRALSKEIFLILGKKGSGKTILAEYLNKLSFSDPTWFSAIRSYKDFKFHELIHLQTDDIKPNEYVSIWEWVILLDLAKQCLLDERTSHTSHKEKLITFFQQNYYSIDIDSKRIIEITKKNKIKGSVLKQSAEIDKECKIIPCSYLYYLEDLRGVVYSLLSSSESKFTLFYDELDDRFRNNEEYCDSIISLIKAADRINLNMQERHLGSRIFLLLRSDIFALFNDPDLNKIKMDNTLSLEWGSSARIDSPLIDLIISKVKVSVPELSQMNTKYLFKNLFPKKVKGIQPSRYVIERTFFRPRDIITFLNLGIKKYPDAYHFGPKVLRSVTPKYSEYFYNEIRNELSGHIGDSEIDEATRLLKHFNLYQFNFKQINKYYLEHKSMYSSIDLHTILKLFFKFNIIGNKWYNRFKRRDYYCWSYRDTKAEIDFDKDFVVHLGLRDELSI